MSVEATGIDGLLQAAVAGGAIHGIAALVVDRDGVRQFAHAGMSGPDTLYRNASMTKAVATTCALQLLEQGRFGLDTPVAEILPEWGDLKVLEGFDGDTPILRAPRRAATIEHLMTHTSGSAYTFYSADLMRYAQMHGLPQTLDGRRAALQTPLACDPGERWVYGMSTDWLGLVVEAVSGQSLAEYAREHVYGPLGMDDSGFSLSDAQRERLLPLRARQADGSLAETRLDLPLAPEWDAGGHGSYGSIQDYGRFIRAWLRDGELDGARILTPETVALAFSDHLNGAPLPEIMRSVIPELSHDVPTLQWPQGWGLGFHLTRVDIPGMRHAGTGDWAGIFNSYYWIDRTAGIGAVLMTQVLPFFDQRVLTTLVQVEAAVYAEIAAAAA